MEVSSIIIFFPGYELIFCIPINFIFEVSNIFHAPYKYLLGECASYLLHINTIIIIIVFILKTVDLYKASLI